MNNQSVELWPITSLLTTKGNHWTTCLWQMSKPKTRRKVIMFCSVLCCLVLGVVWHPLPMFLPRLFSYDSIPFPTLFYPVSNSIVSDNTFLTLSSSIHTPNSLVIMQLILVKKIKKIVPVEVIGYRLVHKSIHLKFTLTLTHSSHGTGQRWRSGLLVQAGNAPWILFDTSSKNDEYFDEILCIS